MTTEEREQLQFNLQCLISIYGPWAILWEVTKLLKPEFKALEAKQTKKRARPRGPGRGGNERTR